MNREGFLDGYKHACEAKYAPRSLKLDYKQAYQVGWKLRLTELGLLPVKEGRLS